ncbi:MAG TPA: hypothetical protein VN193_13710 [Candidatus Angelobacter sp.]|jgi:hypothetical protein|nr:hypothetical protein [Candidatus Angelobacter sp.]
MHAEERLTALVTEARWRTAASLLVLPLLLLGMVTVAVLAFGALEMGLATAQRRPLQALRPVARRAASARGAQAS